MYDDPSSTLPKLPLTGDGEDSIQSLGRWMRVVGTIQLAFSGLMLVLLLLSFACGFALSGPQGAGVALVSSLIPIAIAGIFLLQALRTQEAGEQFKNLADEHDIDYLELAFVRLETVVIVGLVAGALSLLWVLLRAGS